MQRLIRRQHKRQLWFYFWTGLELGGGQAVLVLGNVIGKERTGDDWSTAGDAIPAIAFK